MKVSILKVTLGSSLISDLLIVKKFTTVCLVHALCVTQFTLMAMTAHYSTDEKVY